MNSGFFFRTVLFSFEICLRAVAFSSLVSLALQLHLPKSVFKHLNVDSMLHQELPI